MTVRLFSFSFFFWSITQHPFLILISLIFKEPVNCIDPVDTCFDGDMISSTLPIRFPSDMIHLVEKISKNDLICLKCSLGYTQVFHSLILVAQTKEVIPEVKVVINLYFFFLSLSC